MNIIPTSLQKNFLTFSSIKGKRQEPHIKTSRAENRRHVRARGGAAVENEGVPSAESDGKGEDGSCQGHQQAQRSSEGLHLSSAGRCTRRLYAPLRQENGRGQHFRYIIKFKFRYSHVEKKNSRSAALSPSLSIHKIKFFFGYEPFPLKVFLRQLLLFHFIVTRKTKIIIIYFVRKYIRIFSS